MSSLKYSFTNNLSSFLIVIFISLSILSFAFMTKINLSYNKDNSLPFAKLCLGTKKECFSLFIDTDSIFSLIHSGDNKSTSQKKYNLSSDKSSINKKDKDIKLNDGTKIDILTDIIKIDEIENKKGRIGLIKKSDNSLLNNIEGIFGLGFPSTAIQEKNSLIVGLYNNDKFEKKIWTLDLSSEDKPVIKDSKPKEEVGTNLTLIENEDGHWLFNIKYILLGKNTKNNIKIKFDEDEDDGIQFKISTINIKSSIPLNSLKKFSEKYFKNLIDNKECKFSNNDKNWNGFICKKNNYEDLSDISLILGDYGINIPKENIFIKNDNNKDKDFKYEFILSNFDGDDNASIGLNLLKGKQILFDAEELNIGFYGKNIFDISKVKEEKKEEEKEEKKEDKNDNDDEPIIKPKDNKKEEEKKQKEEEEKKQKEEEEKKQKEEEEKKQKEKEEEDKKNQNNNNDNLNNNEKIVNKEIPEVPKSGGFLKKLGIFIFFIFILCLVWRGYKNYRKRAFRAKSPFTFKSNQDIFNNATPLITD